jgi:hypothetical protein
VQKMMVGGGCIGISSSGSGFRDALVFPWCVDFLLDFPALIGSGGALRSDAILSGG